MKIIKVRSPFLISINEALQIGSKVELFIYNKSTSEPATPTYTLSKPIASTTQLENVYNISNYIREYITATTPAAVSTPTIESNINWAICKVKRYKLIGVTYTLLDTVTYIALDGFSTNNEVSQTAINTEVLALKNTAQTVQYFNINVPYFNLVLNRDTVNRYVAKYYNAAGTLFSTQEIISAGSAELFNYKVPLVYQNSVRAEINLELVSTIATFKTEKIEEYKYAPVVCSFINRYGGWEFLTFFKAKSNSISVKGTDYKISGQTKRFNINGSQTEKLNTGWVNENYSELITDLLFSETVLLNGKSVILKTQGTDLKTSLKDGLINYEIDFEYAYNLINDIV